jgi:hypothetical protein
MILEGLKVANLVVVFFILLVVLYKMVKEL